MRRTSLVKGGLARIIHLMTEHFFRAEDVCTVTVFRDADQTLARRLFDLTRAIAQRGNRKNSLHVVSNHTVGSILKPTVKIHTRQYSKQPVPPAAPCG